MLYGDFNNWFAAFAFWVFKYYGYENLKLINRGRRKWLDEDRIISNGTVVIPKGKFDLAESFKPDAKIRVYLSDIKDSLVSRRRFQIRLVDVRSPPEYTGQITSPPEYPTEHAHRAGPLPEALNIPCTQVLNDDGTFKSAELSDIYQSRGILPSIEVITYCRIEERSSH